MRVKQLGILGLAFCISVGLSSRAVAASIDVDPELLRITAFGSAFPASQTDPVPIGTDGFRLNFISDGANGPLLDPVLVFLGIPTGGIAPTLTYDSGTAVVTNIQLGGTNVWGGTWDTAGPTPGLAGTFNSSSTGSAYDVAGIECSPPAGGTACNGSASQNFTNWDGATSGVSAWDIYVYQFTFNPDFATGTYADIASTLAANTFVIAFGCDSTTTRPDSTDVVCDGNANSFATPFTYAGLVTGGTSGGGQGSGGGGGGGQDVPEPVSLALFGLAAMGVAYRARMAK